METYTYKNEAEKKTLFDQLYSASKEVDKTQNLLVLKYIYQALDASTRKSVEKIIAENTNAKITYDAMVMEKEQYGSKDYMAHYIALKNEHEKQKSQLKARIRDMTDREKGRKE